MENMDKELTVPKWVVIVRAKIPQMPQSLSAQFVCPTPKVLDFNEMMMHWASVVRALVHEFSIFTRFFSIKFSQEKLSTLLKVLSK